MCLPARPLLPELVPAECSPDGPQARPWRFRQAGTSRLFRVLACLVQGPCRQATRSARCGTWLPGRRSATPMAPHAVVNRLAQVRPWAIQTTALRQQGYCEPQPARSVLDLGNAVRVQWSSTEYVQESRTMVTPGVFADTRIMLCCKGHWAR